MSWDSKLIKPVKLLNGKTVVTLADARTYVLPLPEDRQNDPNVLAGVEALLMAAEGRGPMLSAQSGVAHIVNGPVQLLNRGKSEQSWKMRARRD